MRNVTNLIAVAACGAALALADEASARSPATQPMAVQKGSVASKARTSRFN